MPKVNLSRGMAAVVLPAVLTVGSLSLAATPASACGGSPLCGGGPPPVAAASLHACTSPDCVSGTPPAAAPCALRPECQRPTPRAALSS